MRAVFGIVELCRIDCELCFLSVRLNGNENLTIIYIFIYELYMRNINENLESKITVAVEERTVK